MKYDVSIITVNYNGKKYNDIFFDSLFKINSGGICWEIIFVDNNSSDDSVSAVEKKYLPLFQNLKIIKSNKNRGFAGGNNLGVKEASGEYVIFLNNDTAVDPNWLKNILSCIKTTKAGIVVSKLVFYPKFIKIDLNDNNKPKTKEELLLKYKSLSPANDSNGIDIIQNVGSAINSNYDGYDIGFLEEDKGQYNEVTERQSACGAAMCISKKDFTFIGGFDERFFMYYEDSDLSFRLRRMLNKKIIYCPTALVRHFHTGSSVEWSPFFCYYVFRNKQLFVLKNYPITTFVKSYFRFLSWVVHELFSKSRTYRFKMNLLKSALSVIFNIPRYIFKNNY